MLIGETIVGKSGAGVETEFSTPFFPRQGDALTSVVEVIAMSADTKIIVELWQKNSEETGQGTLNGTGLTVTTPSVGSMRNTGAKELVRYKIYLSEHGASPTPNPDIYCHFRILSPSWETTGAQSL